VRESCPNKTGITETCLLVFPFPQTVDVKHGADSSTAAFKVILNIFREVQYILTFNQEKGWKQHLERQHDMLRGASAWGNTNDLLSNSLASSYQISFQVCKEPYKRVIFIAISNVLHINISHTILF